MTEQVPDRSGRLESMPADVAARFDAHLEKLMAQDVPKSMAAKCGHQDPLGYFAGTVCGKCARKNHKKAMGK